MPIGCLATLGNGAVTFRVSVPDDDVLDIEAALPIEESQEASLVVGRDNVEARRYSQL